MLMNMAVRYTSTRNAHVNVSIAEAIVQGMPQDGGLFVPVKMPKLASDALFEPNLSYAELAWMVLSPWFDWPEQELRPLIEGTYLSTGETPMFDVQEIVPLAAAGSLDCDVRLPSASGAPSLFLLELFHGKTCAFKDLALSLLGGLLRTSLEKRGIDEPMLILTATSGDTGSAALSGLGGQPGIRIAVIYPASGTSEIQRLQMTSVPTDGRFVIGLRGNFDDAQRAVKAIFQTASNPGSPFYGLRLSSANSINIGRLLPQIVYYAAAWRDLFFSGVLEKGQAFDVVVPSGNFGDILAARYAKAMGIPIRKLVCASNSNRILHDFFSTGLYDRRRKFSKTLSPSMDILVSSNLERLLYLALDDNPELVAAMMSEFEHEGFFQLP
ncbi:MAG: threonine synthase, partial [Rectinema sp.]